jgi:hypothetical protein
MKLNYFPSSHNSNKEDILSRISLYSGLDVNATINEYSTVTLESKTDLTGEEIKNLDLSMISLGYLRVD